MAKVSVTQAHSVSPEEARERLAGFGELLGKYGVTIDWKGDRATIKGTSVSGDVLVSPGDVTVNVKLGLMARAAGVDPEKLEGSIAKRLAAAFEA